MGRFLVAVVLFALAGQLAAQVSFTSTPNLAIPDNNAFGVTNSINVPATGDRIGALRVGIRINHTYDADLDIWLIPPGVTWAGPYTTLNNGPVIEPPPGVVQLSTNNGGAADNYGSGGAPFTYARFSSNVDGTWPATQSVKAAAAPFTSQTQWIPEGLAAWNAQYGGNPSGTWTIVVADGWAVDTGTLISWQLQYMPLPSPRLIVRQGDNDLPGTPAVPGQADQVLGQLRLESLGATSWTGLTLTAQSGVGIAANFTATRLYHDVNNDGALDGGDMLLATGAPAGSNVTFTLGAAMNLAGSAVVPLLVVGDVAASPAAEGITLEVSAAASVAGPATKFGLFPVVLGFHPIASLRTFTSVPAGGKVIVNNTTIGVLDTITVPSMGDRVASLRVGVRINHNRLQDIDMWLLPPGVTWNGPYTGGGPAGAIELSSDNGANNANYGTGTGPFVYTLFSSTTDPNAAWAATRSVIQGAGEAPFTFRPAYFPEDQADFNARYGQNPAGNWTLVIVDDDATAGNNGGTLLSWQIQYMAHPKASLAGNPDHGSSPVFTPASPQTYTVGNSGDYPLIISAINMVGGQGGDFAVGGISFPAAVPPGGTLDFTVTFTPSGAGLRSTDMQVVHNDSGLPGSTSPLNIFGSGMLAPELRILTGAANQPGEAFQYGTGGAVMGQIEVATGSLAVSVNSIVFREVSDRTLAANFSSMRLYRDTNNDGELDGGDVLLATGVMASGAVTFTPGVLLPMATSENWIVAADILAAPADTWLALEVRAAADVSASMAVTSVLPVNLGPHPFSPQRVFTTTHPGGLAIPNSNFNGITSTIVIPPTTEIVAAFRVGVRINHTRTGDIDMWLLPPGVAWAPPYTGAGPPGAIELSSDNGANGDDYGTGATAPFVYSNFTRAIDPVFTGAIPITGGAAPFVGNYWLPEDAGADLDAIYGVSPQGTWTLVIVDDQGGVAQSGNTGSLLSWQIEYAPPALPAVTGLSAWGNNLVGQPSPLNDQPYLVTNIGGVPMAVTALSIVGTHAGDWSFVGPSGAPVVVPYAASHGLSLAFMPGGLGLRTAALRVTYNNGLQTGLTFDYPLSGTGVTLSGILSTPPGPVDYGTGNVSQLSTLSPVTHTVTNTGTAPLTITAVAFAGTHGTDWVDVTGPVYPVVIPVSGTFDFEFAFYPGGVGPRTGIIRFFSNTGGVPGTPTDVQVTGDGTYGQLTFTPASPTGYGSANIGTSTPATNHTLDNSGTGPLTITNITTTGHTADWNLVGLPATPALLGNGASIPFTGTFSPTALGPRSMSIEITWNDGGAPQLSVIVLQGTGTSGSLTFTPASPTGYGSANIGTSTPATNHTLDNTGTGPLTITNITTTGHTADWNLVGLPATPAVLGASGSIPFTGTFSPTALGPRSMSIEVTWNDGGAPQLAVIVLQGTGTSGSLTFTPASPTGYGSANIGTSTPATNHTLDNSGTGPLTISNITTTGHTADWNLVGLPATPAVLGASGSIPFTGTFSPTALGARSMSIEVTWNDGGAPQLSVIVLQGTGTSGALVATPASPVNYGSSNIGVSAPAIPHNLDNIGTGPLTIISVATSGHTGDWNLVTLPSPATVIGGGGAYGFTGTFTPTTTGSRSMTIDITWNDGGGPQLTVIVLEGTGTSATAGAILAVGPDNGGPVAVTAQVNTGLPGPFDVAVTYTGGANPGPAVLASAGGHAFTGNVIHGIAPNAPFTFEWDAYATERHVNGSYSVVITPQPSGTPGASAAFNLTRQGGWAQHVTPGAQATGVYSHTMVFDAPNNRVVVFGGRRDGDKLNTVMTFEMSGGQYSGWRTLSPAGAAPAGRQYAHAVYDSANQRMVMFGGQLDTGVAGDTWVLNLARGAESWTQLAPAAPPSARRSGVMIYDSMRQRAVLFGGLGAAQTNDVWALDLDTSSPTHGEWSPLSPGGTSPSARFGHIGIHDPAGDRMVIVGGRAGSTDLIDIHQLDLATLAWSSLAAGGTAPLGRYFTTWAFDETNRVLALQSGYRGSTAQRDAWVLDLSGAPLWAQVAADNDAALGRVVGGGVYDGSRLLFYGGVNGAGLVGAEVSVLDVSGAPTWQSSMQAQSDSTGPEGRWGGVMGYDGAGDRVLAWGGKGHVAYYGSVWALDRSTPGGQWARLAPSGSAPVPTVYPARAIDVAGNRMFVHGGGQPAGGSTSQLWSLNMATGAWTALAGAGPAARDLHSMVYDSLRNRLIVFGGRAPGIVADVWAYDITGATWTQVMPAAGPAPVARYGHGASYDAVNDRMVIFAGRSSSAFLNDVWTLSLNPGTEAWTNRSALFAPIPSGRQGFSHAADANGTRIWLHGGDANGANAELWELNVGGAFTTWTPMPVMGSAPQARYYGAACNDGADLYVGFGFMDNRGASDMWHIDANNPIAGWAKIGQGDTPASIVTSASAYDPVGRRLVAFGGLGGGVHNADLWQLDMSGPVAQWSALNAGPGPSARRAASMVYDDSVSPPRMLMYGGRRDYSAASIVDELWALVLDPGNEHWVQLAQNYIDYPDGRTNHRAVVAGGRMIIFGGQTPTASRSNDLFALDIASLTWSRMTPTGTPPSERFSGIMAYDPPRNRLIVHGGNTGGTSPLSDAFVLDLAGAGAWAPLAATGTLPGALYYHSAVIDPAGQRMIVSGGYSTSAESRTFILNLATDHWTESPGTVARPQPRWAHAATWDVDRMVIAGGYLQGEISATQQGGATETWFWGD
ncbi:MAG: choice-of-anchor D domain-containing protein [Planctomycetes bacterium]|nr:choice-of-anchor D domain-containing protein [Planctomycetota bacterium]MCW8136795.1 choice-of-anchor D domain-containing protein [Planctomycetota bacterium]